MFYEYQVIFVATVKAATEEMCKYAHDGWRVASTAADSSVDDPGLWITFEKQLGKPGKDEG